jgi:hypothetical protein
MDFQILRNLQIQTQNIIYKSKLRILNTETTTNFRIINTETTTNFQSLWQ